MVRESSEDAGVGIYTVNIHAYNDTCIYDIEVSNGQTLLFSYLQCYLL